MTHKNSLTDYMLDLDSIREDESDTDNETGKEGVDNSVGRGRRSNSLSCLGILRKQSFLSSAWQQRLSQEEWVDINNESTLQPPKNNPNSRPKRVSFEKRSFSTDSWVDLNADDLSDGESSDDRLQVHQSYDPSRRRESFLYRSESEPDTQPPRSSRQSSISTEGVHFDELVTPFAQILSSLRSVRAGFLLLTNIRQNRFRRGSEGFHANTRMCQLYEISDGSMIRDDMYKKLTMETLKEFDWCLDQLDSLKASMSISEMASDKFTRLLDRELKDFSQNGVGAPEISAWVFDTFVGYNFLEADVRKIFFRVTLVYDSTKRMRLQRSLTSLKDNRHQNSPEVRRVSFSGPFPRFGTKADKNDVIIEKIFENIDTWNFDVFNLADSTENRPLTTITYFVLESRDLLKTFKIKPWILTNYISLVESHYMKDVPFHNSTHAADVVHATHVLLSSKAFEGVFTDLEILAALIGSAIHDVDHPGFNNQFLVNTGSEKALLYNDESVLENHHLAVAFRLMRGEECDILESLSKDERKKFRKMVIEMVLATDNAKHMNILGSLKTMVETKKLSDESMSPLQLETFPEKMHVLKCLVHCADLSNPVRPLYLYETWVKRLMEEFFRQGDIERAGGMEISPMMDRHNANIEKSQVVFIDYVVLPLWETWAELVHPDAQPLIDNLQKNRKYFNSQCQENTINNNNTTDDSKTGTTTDNKTTLENTGDNATDPDMTKKFDASSILQQKDSSPKMNKFLINNDIELFKTIYDENGDLRQGPAIDRRRSDTDAMRPYIAQVKTSRQHLFRSNDNKSTDIPEKPIEPLASTYSKKSKKKDLNKADVVNNNLENGKCPVTIIEPKDDDSPVEITICDKLLDTAEEKS